ncbi:MAG TPA: tyrosine-protein phosphatase, partial [Urbifossiella sp.]|nr:tyrosine-protein phosphatase [Urbifossiella sp.]
MDAPRFTRRRLLRLAGAAAGLGLTAEACRVFFLTNRHTIIPGRVYRSAQLSADALTRAVAADHIRTVVNLRGTCPDTPWYLAEARATVAADVNLEDVSLSAKRLPAPAEIRRLVEILDRTEYPILFHCQQGADRTGLAATMVLLLHTDAPPARARRQLWPRYGHISAGRTAAIDQFFDYYEAWLAARGEAHTRDRFRHWAAGEYCPGPYRARFALVNPPAAVAAGRGFALNVRAENTSIEPWVFRTGPAGGIQLRYQLYTPTGTRVYLGHAGRLAATVAPGAGITLAAGLPPVTEPGRYVFHADLLDTQAIDLHDADFVQYGSEPLV